jgi:pimeloyl-ACP methyl ester carboxylesterase
VRLVAIRLLGFTVFITTAAAAATQKAPSRDEEIIFTNGEVKLAGTLTLPAGRGPFPAVVLLSGSGAQNRDSEIVGFRPFKLIAEHLSRTGIAVLRYDDRGVGASSGSIPESTTDDFSGDALSAVRLLAARSDIQKARVGLVGHSEGALTAAIAASKSGDVAFIVWLAGSGFRGDELLRQQATDLARANGADAETLGRILAAHKRMLELVRDGGTVEEITAITRTLARAQVETLPEKQRKAIPNVDAAVEAMLPAQVAAMRSTWFRSFIFFDPASALEKVTCPVLAIFGERDMQVPPALNRPPVEAALARAGNRQVTTKVYPESNHLFQRAQTGHPSEYATLPKEFVPGLLDDIAAWIAAR